MTHDFEIDSFEYEGKFYSIGVSVEYEVDNDGIGAYEYWGAKCNDAGTDYASATGWSITASLCHPDGTTEEVADNVLSLHLEEAISDVVHKEMENVDISDRNDDYDDPRDDYCGD